MRRRHADDRQSDQPHALRQRGTRVRLAHRKRAGHGRVPGAGSVQRHQLAGSGQAARQCGRRERLAPGHADIDGSYLVSNFQFRFRAKMSGSDEDANVDNVRLIATSLAGPPNQLPVAVDDAAATAEDTAATIDVLANDADPDSDALQVASVTQPANGVVVNNEGSVTYTPNGGFIGDDSFSYTVSDGNGGTDTGVVTITVSASANDTPLYVYDIRFESETGRKRLASVFEIRSDSNDDGEGGLADSVAAGVAITVQFAGQTYTGTTDSAGMFYTSWINNLRSGTYYADVVDLVLANYYWAMGMDLEDDSDGDGKPDDVLVR